MRPRVRRSMFAPGQPRPARHIGLVTATTSRTACVAGELGIGLAVGVASCALVFWSNWAELPADSVIPPAA